MQPTLSGHFRPSFQDGPNDAFRLADSVGRAGRCVSVLTPARRLVLAGPSENPSDFWADAAEVAAILSDQFDHKPIALADRFLAEQPVTGAARLAEEGLQRSDDQTALGAIQQPAGGQIIAGSLKSVADRHGAREVSCGLVRRLVFVGVVLSVDHLGLEVGRAQALQLAR